MLLGGDDRVPYGVEFAHLPVSGGDLGAIYELIASGDHERQRRELGDGRAASFMAEMNRGFVADGRQREAFSAALRLICSPGRLPLLYHCTGGKDRAGWMTAIVLTALGVPRELVLRDYLLSNDYHRAGYDKLRLDLVKTGIVADPALLRPILEQSATYLGAAFEEADRRYGSFGRFLASWPRRQRGHAGRAAAHAAGRPGAAGTRALSAAARPDDPGGPRPLYPLLAAARAEGAQLDVGEQREDHRQPDHDTHVAEPVARGLGPQRVDDPLPAG